MEFHIKLIFSVLINERSYVLTTFCCRYHHWIVSSKKKIKYRKFPHKKKTQTHTHTLTSFPHFWMVYFHPKVRYDKIRLRSFVFNYLVIYERRTKIPLKPFLSHHHYSYERIIKLPKTQKKISTKKHLTLMRRVRCYDDGDPPAHEKKTTTHIFWITLGMLKIEDIRMERKNYKKRENTKKKL